MLRYNKPKSSYSGAPYVPQTSDEFESETLGKQWQWMSFPSAEWYSLAERKGFMRLFACAVPEENGNLNYAGNLLLQKVPAPSFSATTKVDVSNLRGKERCGLITMGDPLKVVEGQWIGAKTGIFCINPGVSDGNGFADFEYFKIE